MIISNADSQELRSVTLFHEAQKIKAHPNTLALYPEFNRIEDQNGNLIDMHLINFMPIFKTDTLDDIIKRWADVFKEEAYTFGNVIKDHVNSLDHNGFTEGGNMRLAMQLPPKLYEILQIWSPDFFSTENIKKSIKRIQAVLPSFVIGNV